MSSLSCVAVAAGLALAFVSRDAWVDKVVPANTPYVTDYLGYSEFSGTTAVSEPSHADEHPLASGTRTLDRYGNQIETAVGDYRIDPRGDVYERHSPETALPDLASPEI